MRKPYYRKDRKCWFVKSDDGRTQTRLSPDESEAYRLWQEMAESATTGTSSTLAALSESYLQHNQRSLSAGQWKRSGYYLADFANHYRGLAREVRPINITEWIDSHKSWGDSSKIAAISTVKRLFSWAVEQGILTKSPVAAIKKPGIPRREGVVSEEVYKAILDASDDNFGDFVKVLWFTGARPGTISIVTASDVSECGETLTVKSHKSAKKTGRPLSVHLHSDLKKIISARVEKYKTGLLFRNSEGEKWTKDSINCRFKRMRTRGIVPAGITAYSFRHTFATRAIKAGVDLPTIAELLGHSDVSMIAKHYGHIDKETSHLKAAIKKVGG